MKRTFFLIILISISQVWGSSFVTHERIKLSYYGAGINTECNTLTQCLIPIKKKTKSFNLPLQLQLEENGDAVVAYIQSNKLRGCDGLGLRMKGRKDTNGNVHIKGLGKIIEKGNKVVLIIEEDISSASTGSSGICQWQLETGMEIEFSPSLYTIIHREMVVGGVRG